MANSNHLVSVCVNTFNRKDSLLLTIKSILKQTYNNFEIIIVDDCSTDGTEKLVESQILKLDSRIIYIRNKKNRGLAFGRNQAIHAARGKFFTFCDDDDIWKENFIENFINQAKKYNESYSFCASKLTSKKNLFVGIKSSYKNFILLGFTPPVASQFYLTKVLKNIGGYNENIKSGVDHDLWLNLASNNFNLVYLNEDLSIPNSIFSEKRMTQNANKRLKKIKNSIVIWRNEYKNTFDNNFFNFLDKCYEYNSYKKFMIQSIKNFSLFSFFNYFRRLPKDLFIIDIFRYIARRIYKILPFNHKSIFPPLFPTKGKDIKEKIEYIMVDNKYPTQ